MSTSSPTPSLHRRSSLKDYFANGVPRLPSLRSRRSNASITSVNAVAHGKDISASTNAKHAPYAVYQQSMAPVILRDADATAKLLETILVSPGGKRSLARLARTCRAFKDPALDVLWRDLDTFVPLVTLFPNTLLKRARRPGLGFVRNPEGAEWDKALAYGERVKSIQYVEAFNTFSQTIFTVLEACPREYLLPNLTSLTWKAETAAGLNYVRPYLAPGLRSFTLEMGVRAPKINDLLDEVMAKTQLSQFSFTLHSNLPESFVDTVRSAARLEKLALLAPGALAARVGKWASSLPLLRSLALDLSNQSMRAVDNFFSEITPQPGSGYSTPSSFGHDSGVFSADDDLAVDFTDVRRSVARFTSDGPRHVGAFTQLTALSLAGEAGTLAAFLRHLGSPLVQLELSIEDPPPSDDWQDLCSLLGNHFGQTLRTLKISPSSTARFNELVRSTSRAGDVELKHLPLVHFGRLPQLYRFEIELPESAVFFNEDLAHLARVCPNLEIARLCGQARFPPSFGPPPLTLEGLIPLTSGCTRLHTLAVVVHAADAADATFKVREHSSRALMRLNVGHSWVKDPLAAAILLSHIAPHLEILRWFATASRSGVVERHAEAWQKVQDYLPQLQRMRLIERSLMPKPVVIEPPRKTDKEVDATPTTAQRGVLVRPTYVDSEMQVEVAEMVEMEVQALPETSEEGVDATPLLVEAEVDAIPQFSEQAIEALPEVEEKAIDTTVAPEASAEDRLPSPTDSSASTHSSLVPIVTALVPSVHGIVTLPFRAVRVYTYYLSWPLRYMFSFTTPLMPSITNYAPITQKLRRSASSSSESQTSMEPMSPSSPSHEHANGNAPMHSTDTTHDVDFSNAMHISSSLPAPKLARLPNWGEALKRTNHVVSETPEDALRATRQSVPPLFEPRPHSSFTSTWFARPTQSRRYDMAEPKKQEKDFTKEVDAIIPEAQALAKSGQLQESVDKLLVLEKQTRNASDLASTTRLVKEICQQCYDARDYEKLNANILLLSKKHGQLKASIQAMVEQAMGWLEEIKQRDGTERWLELIDTLRSVTEGKIFLETPRARVTLLLAHYHESLANSPTPTSPPPKESIQTASDLLSDLQVETYSSMERREKTEFILEQMRLLIMVAKEKDKEKGVEGKKDAVVGGDADWVKVRVGGRKVSEKFLEEKENEDLKLKYYDLMIQYDLQHSEYLSAAKHYYKVWETPSIKAEENGRGREALEHIIYYVVLAPHDNEQSDMLNRLYKNPALERLALQYALSKCFVTPEIMRWPHMEALYGPHLRETDVFKNDKRWEDLHTRIIEHNIRTIAQYYTRIRLSHLTTLLDLTLPQTEEILCRLVVSGTVWARIDRPAGIVSFRQSRTAEDVMNDWSSDMSKLLSLVEKTWMGVNAAQAAQARAKAVAAASS